MITDEMMCQFVSLWNKLAKSGQVDLAFESDGVTHDLKTDAVEICWCYSSDKCDCYNARPDE